MPRRRYVGGMRQLHELPRISAPLGHFSVSRMRRPAPRVSARRALVAGPPLCGVRDDSIVADALPRPRASRAFADRVARCATSSTSSRLTSVLNDSEMGPSLTAIVAFQFSSSTASSTVAPGIHGMTRGTSISSAHACSGGADTSEGWPWVGLLGVFALAYSAFGLLGFGALMEEQ